MIISRKKYNEAIKQARAEALQTYIDKNTQRIQDTIAEAIDQVRKSEERILWEIDKSKRPYKTDMFVDGTYTIIHLQSVQIVEKDEVEQFPNLIELYTKKIKSDLASRAEEMVEVIVEDEPESYRYKITGTLKVGRKN